MRKHTEKDTFFFLGSLLVVALFSVFYLSVVVYKIQEKSMQCKKEVYGAEDFSEDHYEKDGPDCYLLGRKLRRFQKIPCTNKISSAIEKEFLFQKCLDRK